MLSFVRIFCAAGVILLCAILSSPPALAQIDYDSGDDTVFAHSETLPWWMSGQVNSIFQWHPSFHAQYSGANSFEHASEQADSEVATLYMGLALSPSLEAVADVENSGGSGLSQTLGLAGFTDLDAVRNPSLSPAPYLARLWYRKVIALSDDTISVERTPTSMLTTLPVRRLDIHVGKFDMVDFFDLNSVANDSHTQFMNWTVVNNGAYDYAADTRGYTWGGVIDYEDRWWGARFAEALISKRPNGLTLQKNLQDAHSENYEIEVRPELIEKRDTTVRILAFTNFANMGDYHEAIDLFEDGKTPTPEIDDHPMRTTLKYGFGLNAEQEFTDYLRGFARAGWNEGEHESFNYTEVNDTVAFGGDLRGTLWDRPEDKFGVAFVGNGISQRHRQYLADGGLGFLLGDGGLSYGPERIMESYYNFPIPVHAGFFGAIDIQYIDNPGYNRARGPVVVPGMRVHVEL
ncbi:MAG TPA: carbohydrate porin [Candidatus Acidoferrales bacterium]|nr:carbohydrate porin [Candidatus Acidoferrales bacterium]